MTQEELENFEKTYEFIDDISYNIFRFLKQNKPKLFNLHDYFKCWEIDDGKLYIHIDNPNDVSRCLPPIPLDKLINGNDLNEYLINNF